MPKVTLFKQDGTESGDLELVSSVFVIEPNTHVIQKSILMDIAANPRGTHADTPRAAVRGGGIKSRRPNGPGHARHRLIRSPRSVRRAVAFGPKPARNYIYKLPQKV